MSKPQIVITAAGSNSRFFPLNTQVHKGAITLLGESFISRTLRSLAEHGFSDAIIVQSERDQESGSLKKAIEACKSNLNIHYVVQKEAKGMGDALLSAREYLTDKFFVIFPDLINAGEIADKMLSANSDATICTTKTTEPWLYGIVEVENGHAKAIEEKPAKGTQKSDLKINGCYLLNQKYLEILSRLPEAEYNFEQALDELFKTESVRVVELEESVFSLKYPWHLFKFQSILFNQLVSKVDPTAEVAKTAILDESKGPIVIEAGAKVGDFAKIVGPSYLGKNTLVGDYSFVRQSSLEESSVIGANTELVRSIILENSTLHFSYAADSIIGPNNQIGAGLITANKRLNRESINTMVKGIKTDTGLTALGIITGDGAKLGIGLNTMPGVLIGSEAKIFPGLTISKNVEHEETIQRS